MDIKKILKKKRENKQEPQIYYADDLISIYTAFRDQVYNSSSVLYPSSGFDASPAKVFDKVTFVDMEDGNHGCVKKLQEAGLDAVKQDIREYTPNDLHDMLILLNPSIPTEWASKHLKSGGYIISNDYHRNASEMYKKPDQFDLWGTIDFVEKDRRKKNNEVVISRDLEDLFQPVANEEELKRYRSEHYEFLEELFKVYGANMASFNADRPFGEKWSDYRKMMRLDGMPAKRISDRYIFTKK